ncbi:MAG: DUF3568 family protein [Syntrophales bacterium]
MSNNVIERALQCDTESREEGGFLYSSEKEFSMSKIKFSTLLVVLGSFALSGCAFLVGGAAVGAGVSGTYVWVNGEMRTDYYAPFEKVWAAVEKTVADMHGIDVEPSKEIAQGKINVIIDDEKVLFSVKYKEKNVTTVGIRVGIMGNKLSSQLLHDKIAENLAKKK